MDANTLNTILYIGFALLSAAVTCLCLVRIGNFRLAALCGIIMFIIRFILIFFIDLEPIGELSTFSDTGTPLPAWLVAAGYFDQFGAYGALMATSILHDRARKNKKTAQLRDSQNH